MWLVYMNFNSSKTKTKDIFNKHHPRVVQIFLKVGYFFMYYFKIIVFIMYFPYLSIIFK